MHKFILNLTFKTKLPAKYISEEKGGQRKVNASRLEKIAKVHLQNPRSHLFFVEIPFEAFSHRLFL